MTDTAEVSFNAFGFGESAGHVFGLVEADVRYHFRTSCHKIACARNFLTHNSSKIHNSAAPYAEFYSQSIEVVRHSFDP